MTFLGKNWRLGVLLGLSFFGLYAFSRLINLTALPIFTDEAIYIRWSQIGSRDAAWRFISLTDGKQPMFTWMMMAYMKVIGDPLLAGRLVSVTVGAGTLIGLGFLSYELFKNRRVSIFTVLLYLLSPFSLMYDRMALYDSLVATFSVWSLYLSILLVRTVRLDVALLLGLTLGAGMLNKTSGFLSLYLLPFTLILFDWHQKGRVKKRLAQWFLFVVLAAILSQMLYGVLRLSPLFHMVSQKDALFVYPLKEWFTHPFRFLEGNFRGLFDWLVGYLTIPMFLLILLPIIATHRKSREVALLTLWWLIPFVGLALFGKVLYPRFILFMTMPLLVLGAMSFDWIGRSGMPRAMSWLLFIVIVSFSLVTDFYILFDPIHAPIPKADSGQYINDWPAGWGVTEVNAYFRSQASSQKIAIYTEGTFGLFPYAIEIDLVDNPNVEIHGVWPLPSEIPKDILEKAATRPTFMVLNMTQNKPPNWPLELIHSYQKGNNPHSALHLYRVSLPTSEKH